jgi:hypothetical protein
VCRKSLFHGNGSDTLHDVGRGLNVNIGGASGDEDANLGLRRGSPGIAGARYDP